MKSYIPSKHALITGLIITMIGLFIYNRVPKLKSALQGQAST